jgi:hypothetical protein
VQVAAVALDIQVAPMELEEPAAAVTVIKQPLVERELQTLEVAVAVALKVAQVALVVPVLSSSVSPTNTKPSSLVV